MIDRFITTDEIKQELNEIENLGVNLTRNLSSLSQKIKYIFSQIQQCETLHLANDYFDILERIQLVLAILIYREELGLADALISFTSDFDRIDDPKIRQYIFDKIKNNKYRFGMKLE